jgi:hypothetical protein
MIPVTRESRSGSEWQFALVMIGLSVLIFLVIWRSERDVA